VKAFLKQILDDIWPEVWCVVEDMGPVGFLVVTKHRTRRKAVFSMPTDRVDLHVMHEDYVEWRNDCRRTDYARQMKEEGWL